MRDTTDMAREAGFEVMRLHGVLPHVPKAIFIANACVTEEVKRLVALVRADEREEFQRWYDAVTAQHKQLILAEREACAKVCETEGIGAKYQGDVYAEAIRARSAGEPRTPADTAEIEEMAILVDAVSDIFKEKNT